MSDERTYRIMISGGGTGGHIFPAISIAQALEKELSNPEILFVGAKGKMEMTKVPDAGYRIIGLWISGLQRKISLQNLMFPFKVISSVLKSFSLLRSFKPDVVVGVGGYASGPLLYAASAKKIPTLIQEQNSFAGLTNKWLSKRVDKICVAHDKMDRYFPMDRIELTGNPVRSGIALSKDSIEDSFKHFGFEAGRPTIFMTGGSLGARTLNEAMMASIQKFMDQGFQVIWQCGGFYFEEMKSRTEDLDMTNIRLFDFLKDMDKAYLIADVVIGRAGALSIAELALTGKASILIPSPNVAEDHQTKNAMSFVDKEAAILIKDSDAVNQLADVTFDLLNDDSKRGDLEKNIKKLARPDAQTAIAKEVIKLVA